jgi:hypothetical protein
MFFSYAADSLFREKRKICYYFTLTSTLPLCGSPNSLCEDAFSSHGRPCLLGINHEE